MKNHFLVLSLLCCFVFSAQAQKKQHKKPEFTVEQQTTLDVKKMTLALDLSSSQQEKMRPVLLEMNTKKQAAMAERGKNKNTLSTDELYSKMIAKLDDQIAFQQKIKDILKKDQYAQWKEYRSQKHKAEMQQKGKQKHKSKKQ